MSGFMLVFVGMMLADIEGSSVVHLIADFGCEQLVISAEREQ